MEFINFSNIHEFIYIFLIPIIKLIFYIFIALIVLGKEYYIGLKSIIINKPYYILYKKIFIPFSDTPFGKFTKLFYKMITNYFLFTSFIFIAFSYLVDSFTRQIDIFLPPQVLTCLKFSQNDSNILAHIWCHYPEIDNFIDLYYKILSLYDSSKKYNSPFYLSQATYSHILIFCKFSIILVIAISLFYKSSSKYKLYFRTLIIIITLILIYIGTTVLYVKSIRYEDSMEYQRIYDELKKSQPINYDNTQIEQNEQIIENYNSNLPDFKITFMYTW